MSHFHNDATVMCQNDTTEMHHSYDDAIVTHHIPTDATTMYHINNGVSVMHHKHYDATL